MFRDLDEEEDGSEMPDELISHYYSPLARLFGLVIYNEAHALKSVKTFTAVNVANLYTDTLVFLTGTLMMNRVVDLGGLLAMLWNNRLDTRLEI